MEDQQDSQKNIPINSERSIFLTESIGRDAFNRLFPEIMQLRADSSEPIYLYIDSLGGSTYYSDRIYELLSAPNCVGESCKIISIAPQLAASAAADLLIQGDHAMVGKDAKIHCHGTRVSRSEITQEELSAIDNNLKLSNRIHTLRLSRCVARRLSQRVLWINQGTHIPRISPLDLPERNKDGLIFNDAREYLTWIDSDLSEVGQKVLKKAFQGFDEWLQPTFSPLSKGGELKKHAKEAFEFELENYNFGDTESTIESFAWGLYRRLSQQYAYGLYTDATNRESLVEIALYHLSDSQFELIKEEFENLSFEMEQKILQVSGIKHMATSYMSVTICEALHADENPLTAVDAYLLGLIDEIQGLLDYPSIDR